MSGILVDTSVWIAFFRGNEEARTLFPLIDTNQICTNDLILAELIPFLSQKKETTLVALLRSIEKTDLEIDWRGIIQMQMSNLEKGINRVGIPDLIIAQNAIENGLKLLSFDRHFELMKKGIGLELYELK